MFQKWLGSPFPEDVWAWWLLMHWLQLQFIPCENLPSVWIGFAWQYSQAYGHLMNLKYMKVSLFEISYKKKCTLSRYIFFFRTCIYIYIYIYILGVAHTVHVFVTNRHITDLSVRCVSPYNKYRQYTPNPEGDARSNATLFKNRQQKNSRRTWKQSPLDSDHVVILNASLT